MSNNDGQNGNKSNVADATRIVPLDGALNFRDLGGYETLDGGRIKFGKIYRSDSLSELTTSDQTCLIERGIRFVWDLRSTGERTRRPFRQGEKWQAKYCFRDYENSLADLRSIASHGDARPESTHAMMINAYSALPHEQIEAFRKLFRHIADGDLPLVFNCAAGKDRTGVAAALLLDLLGVTEELIFENYLLSKNLRDHLWGRLSSEYPELLSGRRELWDPLIDCRRDYLEAMFASIEESYGSTEFYFQTALGIGVDDCASIRHQLIEYHPE